MELVRAAAAEQPVGAVAAGDLAPVRDPCVPDDGAVSERRRNTPHEGAHDPAVVAEDHVGILAAIDLVVAVGEPAGGRGPVPVVVEDPVERRAPADQVVLSCATADDVAAGVAFDRVVAFVARQRVVALLADDQVVAGTTGDPVGTAGRRARRRPWRGTRSASVRWRVRTSRGWVPPSVMSPGPPPPVTVRPSAVAAVPTSPKTTSRAGARRELVVADAAEHEQVERRRARVDHVVALLRVDHEGALGRVEGCGQDVVAHRRC